MKKLIKRIISHLFVTSTKPELDFEFHIGAESQFLKGENCEIRNSTIKLEGKSKLILNDNVTIDGYDIVIIDGEVEIGDNSMLIKGRQYFQPIISVNTGKIIIGSNNAIRATINVRFNGVFQIGEYNAINEETEIRCDEFIKIGDFNMISYQCMIYDTNTHTNYSPEIRRKMTTNSFPVIGLEKEKPSTKSVIIGNDNWFGKRSVILKGCKLGNQVTVGTSAVVSNIELEKGTLIGNPAFILEKK